MSGFLKLKQINGFINGTGVDQLKDVTSLNVKYYKYCIITSVDLQSTFASRKNITDSRRQNSSLCNLEKYIIKYYNKSIPDKRKYLHSLLIIASIFSCIYLQWKYVSYL